MKPTRVIVACLAIVGSCLVGYGLFAPLVTVPVVGAVRFSENNLGGIPAARILISVLIAASILLAFGTRLARIGVLGGSLALGFLGGVLVSLHRHTMDEVMQIADMGDGKMDEGITKLIAQMQYGAGAYCAVIGGGIVLLALVACLLSGHPRSDHDEKH